MIVQRESERGARAGCWRAAGAEHTTPRPTPAHFLVVPDTAAPFLAPFRPADQTSPLPCSPAAAWSRSRPSRRAAARQPFEPQLGARARRCAQAAATRRRARPAPTAFTSPPARRPRARATAQRNRARGAASAVPRSRLALCTLPPPPPITPSPSSQPPPTSAPPTVSTRVHTRLTSRIPARSPPHLHTSHLAQPWRRWTSSVGWTCPSRRSSHWAALRRPPSGRRALPARTVSAPASRGPLQQRARSRAATPCARWPPALSRCVLVEPAALMLGAC